MRNYHIFFVCFATALVALSILDKQQQILSKWAFDSVGGFSTLRASSRTRNKTPDTTTFILQKEERRPPLSSLIADKEANVTGNVQFLLDFAIIGHPKTATSFQLDWVASHPEIQVYKYEIHSLQQGKPALLVSQLYELPAGSNYKRGYKAPRDIKLVTALESLYKYWPDTRLVIGVRHPVTWFESFYNFRVRHGYTMAPAETLDGKCTGESHGVCVQEALFHIHLSMLGKTNASDPVEAELLQPSPSRRPPPMRNKVFLYELSQLHDSNKRRVDQYRRDLSSFLGLHEDLEPIVEESYVSHNHKYALDICLPEFKPLRSKLMKIARASSTWIRTYFLPHPDVTVSSPEYFNELLLKWMDDPCESRETEDEDERRRRLLMWE